MLLNETCALDQATVNQRTKERRDSIDRRADESSNHVGAERRKMPRRTVERRRQIDPTTCERDYSAAEIEFMTAMNDYKRRSGRQFPTWSEVLEVVRSLGYRKVVEATTLEF